MLSAEIIAIGSELLMPRFIDSDSSYLTEQLNDFGIPVVMKAIVGDDETDASAGRIGWSAPLARALIGARVGDERIVRLPAGDKSYEVMAITYPEAEG